MKTFDVNLIKINAVFNQNPYMPTEEAIYSKPSMTRLPWLFRTRFLSPYEILSTALENKYLGKFSYFIM